MITIKEIAKKAGVATSTVSNALAGKDCVTKETTEKILKICEENDYRPNFYASLLSSKKKTDTVALLLNTAINDISKSFYLDMIQSILAVLEKNKKSLLISSGLTNDEAIAKLKSGRAPVDGAIIFQPAINDVRILELKDQFIPFVVIGHPSDPSKCCFVDIDNTQLTYSITKKMIDRGFKDICLINTAEEIVIYKERSDGFLKAINESGDIRHSIESTLTTKKEGYEIALKQLEKGCKAFITCNAAVASGVYEACIKMKKEIGKEIAIFSLGSTAEIKYDFVPKLSYAVQDYKKLGSEATTLLLELINNKTLNKSKIIESTMCFNESFK